MYEYCRVGRHPAALGNDLISGTAVYEQTTLFEADGFEFEPLPSTEW